MCTVGWKAKAERTEQEMKGIRGNALTTLERDCHV